MAFYQVSVSMLDGDGTSTSVQTYITAADEAAATTAVATLAGILDNLSGCLVTSASLAKQVDLSGQTLKPSANADANREHKGMFIFGTGVPGVRPRISIPGILESVIVPGGSIPTNPGGPNPTDIFASHVIDNGFADYRQTDITAFVQALETFR